METDEALRRIRPELSAAGVDERAVRAFERMYRAYRSGETGVTPWKEISPLAAGDLVRFEDLGESEREQGLSVLRETAWLVLNGGLGTSMKMSRAKSLVAVRGDETFLDLLARHVAQLRARWGVDFPLLFMNSFATRDDTLASGAAGRLALSAAGGAPFPLDFVQHRFPRIRERDGLPADDLGHLASWAPPGHGDLYLALETSGALDALLGRGIRWAFVSNVDNLGATLHPGILGLLASRGFEFLMEVTAKTAADVKGGTLIRRGGRLALLELAQVSPDHAEDFQDLRRFPVFNTNSLWVDLRAVRRRLRDDSLRLPLIVNRKSVDGVPVVQLETAMGAAVEAFSPAAGVLVPRLRFAPVKTTDDLLVRRSDVFQEGEESPLVPNPGRDAAMPPPVVRLDPRYYSSVADLDLRIPSPPSLLEARSLEVVGDVRFGRGVVVRGAVRVENTLPQPLHVPDGAVLEG